MFTLNIHKTDKERGKIISQLRFIKVLKNYIDIIPEEKGGGKPQATKLHFLPRPSSLKERRCSGKDKVK
jgi:hypothetical protein